MGGIIFFVSPQTWLHKTRVHEAGTPFTVLTAFRTRPLDKASG